MMRLFPESYGLIGISNGKRINDINHEPRSYSYQIINEPGIRLKQQGNDNVAMLSNSIYPVVGTIGPISLIAFDPQHFYGKLGSNHSDWYVNNEVKTYATELLEDVFKFDVNMVKCFISSVDFLKQKSNDLLEVTQNRQPTKSITYPSSSLFVKEDLAFAIGGIDTYSTGMRRINLTKAEFQKEQDINIKAWLDYISTYLNFSAIRTEIVNLPQTNANRGLLSAWDTFTTYNFRKSGPFLTSREQTDHISMLRGRVVDLIARLKAALPEDKQTVLDKLILKGDAACYWSGYYNINVFKQMDEVTYDPEIEDPKMVRSRYYRSLIKKYYPAATSDGIAALLANFYVDTDLISKAAEGSNDGLPVGEYPGCWNTKIWLDYGGDKLFEEGDPNRDYVVKRGIGLGWWRDTSDGFKRNTNLRQYKSFNNYWYNSEIQIDYMFNGDATKYKALIKELITKTGDVENLTLEIYHNWSGRSGDRESLRTETAAELAVYLKNSENAPYTAPDPYWVTSEINKLKGYDRFEYVFPGYVPDKTFGRMDLGLILRALAGITGSRITGLGSSDVAKLTPDYNTYLSKSKAEDYLLPSDTWHNTVNIMANYPNFTWGGTEGNRIGYSDIGSFQTYAEPSYGVYSGNDLAVQGSKLLTISVLQNTFKTLISELHGVVFNMVTGGPFGVMKSVKSIMGVGADIFQKIAILQNTANTDVLPGIGTNVTYGFTNVNGFMPGNEVSTITSQVFKPKGFVNERTNSMTQTEILSIPVNAVFKSVITTNSKYGTTGTDDTNKTSSELMRYVSKYIRLYNYTNPKGFTWDDSWSFYSKLSIWPSQINGSFVTSMPYEKYFWRIVNSKTSSVRNYTHFR